MNETVAYLKSLLKENDTIVVGLSGGPDSMCLVDILKKLPFKINIICAHINHNIRPESAAELEFVKEYCETSNLKVYTTKFAKKSNEIDYNEAELRELRYAFFEKIVKENNAKYLFTAHHGDDLIETILMRISRGSNIKGYSGFQVINAKNDYFIVKPLIYMTKQEILDYNEEHKISYVLDQTNYTKEHTRNRYRQTILPFLKKENEHIHLKYLKFSNELYKYYNYVDREVTKELQKRYKNKVLDLKNYTKLDPLLQTKIIERVLDDNYEKNLYLVSDKHMYLILDLINNPKPNIELNLPDNLRIIKSYNSLKITRKTKKDIKYHIIISNTTLLPNGKVIEIKEESDSTSNNCIRLNSSEIKWPLFVRNRKEGDRMVIKNMKNSKKIKDIFIDLKLNEEERNLQPIVVDSNDNIIWLPGLKKSQFDKANNEFYDIILWYN